MDSIKLALLILLLWPFVSQADTVVVPNDAQPNSGGEYVAQDNGTTREWQELFPASQFAGQTGTLEITQFAWRGTGGVNSDVELPSLQIRLSTTSTTLSSLSPMLPSNVGPDQTTVFSDSYLLKALPPNSGDGSFNIPFPFTHSFKYSPQQGNLLIDLTITTAPGGPFTLPFTFGKVNDAGGIGLAGSGGSFVYSTGPVTELTFSMIPEPRTCLLMGAGLVLILSFKRK